MSSQPLSVLHVVGGVNPRGGAFDVACRLAACPAAGIQQAVWLHRKVGGIAANVEVVRRGISRQLRHRILDDVWAGLIEAPALLAWVRSRGRVVLHAHTRPGMLAASLVRGVAGTPLLIHLHALAGQPAFYRRLAASTGATLVYNSAKTCRYFGADPAVAVVVPPTIVWPEQPPKPPREVLRLVACGALVRIKHFHLVLEAFRKLRAAGTATELQIFGLQECPPDPAYQKLLLGLSQGQEGVRLERWNARWRGELAANDVFVHLGNPESFGLAILEAFAQGCRLVVLPDTFLDALPEPHRSRGIHRLDALSASDLTAALAGTPNRVDFTPSLWESRRAMRECFSVENGAARLRSVYQSLVAPGSPARTR